MLTPVTLPRAGCRLPGLTKAVVLLPLLWLLAVVAYAQLPRYEAEDAAISGGPNTSAVYGNHSGSGYVEWITSVGAAVEFTVSVATPGRYYVTLRFATNASKTNPTSLNIYLNDEPDVVKKTEMYGGGGWDKWYSKTEILTLRSGQNKIKYKVDNNSQGWVNLDYLWVSAMAANGPINKPITTGEHLVVSRFAQVTAANWALDLLGMAIRPRVSAAAPDQLVVYESTEGQIYIFNSNGTSRPLFNVRDAINNRPLATRDTYFSTDYVRDKDTHSIVATSTYTSEVFPQKPNMATSAHGGLQGVAFPPGYNTPSSPFYRRMYTAVMETAPGTYDNQPSTPVSHHYLHTELLPPRNFNDINSPNGQYGSGHDGVLIEWNMADTLNPVYREVFRIRMPVFDHSIKRIAFNPYATDPLDSEYGLLYIAHGDGSVQSASYGGGEDDNALGKILRIHPLKVGSDNYSIPSGNPWVSTKDTKEIYAQGFRNPHTFSFAKDASNNTRLIVGEAGRDNVEEVNLVVNGGDYGWPRREGTFVHYQQDSGNGIVQGVAPLAPQQTVTVAPAPKPFNEYDLLYPAAQWGHNGDPGEGFVGQANAGGFVIPAPGGQQHYLYADFANSGRIFYSDWQELLGTTRKINQGQLPSVLTQAQVREYAILYDHDKNPATAAKRMHSMLDVVNYDLNAASPGRNPEGRVDLRFGQGPGGEVYLLTKRSGLIYKVQSVTAASGPLYTYEAEDAILSQPPYPASTSNPPPTIRVGSGTRNYRARGYVEWMGPGASVTYDNVEVPAAGNYLVVLHYAAGGPTSTLTVYVNDEAGRQITCPSTGSWSTWKTQTMAVALKAGLNTISYQVVSANNNPANQLNLDYIELRPHTYEAEDAQIWGGNASIGNSWPNYRASGFVENITGSGEAVRFTVQVPPTGSATYAVTLRYAAGSTNGSMMVRVYDQNNQSPPAIPVTFPYTGSWSVWQNKTMSLSLPAGTAYIEYSHDNNTVGNINLDYLAIGECVSCTCTGCEDQLTASSTAESVNVGMYPNPASTAVRFALTEEAPAASPRKEPEPQPAAPYTVALYDQLGRLLWQGSSVESELTMNIANRPVGLYHVVIRRGDKVSSRRLSIER